MHIHYAMVITRLLGTMCHYVVYDDQKPNFVDSLPDHFVLRFAQLSPLRISIWGGCPYCPDHAAVVQDEAVLLAVEQTVHAGDGLQEGTRTWVVGLNPIDGQGAVFGVQCSDSATCES